MLLAFPHMVSTTARRAAPPSKASRKGGEDVAAPLPHAALWIPGSRWINGDSSAGVGVGGGDVEAGKSWGVVMAPSSPIRPLPVDNGHAKDAALHRAEVLTREEVLRRRLRRVRRLEKYYRRQYWGLMEAVRVRHRDYYWNFGRSPVVGEERGGGVEEEENGGFSEGMVSGGRSGEIGRGGVGFGGGEVGGSRKRDKDRCVFGGCKAKAMALTRYCHLHILSDRKQKLYKACTYISKSVHTGTSTCGKPVLRAQPLSYCPSHIKKAQRILAQALKKAGLPQTSNRSLPKINVIIAEYVRQIQSKRKELQRAPGKEFPDMEPAT